VNEPLRAGPAAAAGWLQVVAGLVLLLGTTLADPVGRVLLVPAGLLLAGSGLRDLLLRPVLTADRDGLTVVEGLHRRQLPWTEVEGVRVVTDRRAPLLELDLGTHVVVLSRRRLGRPPYQVLEELQQLRP
jgi:hypothetical protein